MTYSIVAVDPETGCRGVAVASKALCVGAHVPWGAAGVGAVATQAWHDLRYGSQGLALLREGRSAASAVYELTHDDPDAPNRQVGVVDAQGRTASYTGSRCLPWAGGMCGDGYAVQGNILSGSFVVEAMAQAYEDAADEAFARRLVLALLAGDLAGGDRRGRQSAAVRIWRALPSERADAIDTVVDLRIGDDASRPVAALLDMLPRLWLEYGKADAEHARPLAGETLERVGELLGERDPAKVDASLALWASEQNLEGRVLEGAIDEALLEALQFGPATALASAAARPSNRNWPA
jgi:uncharacterized Ntn-hydrolase superfamily protein